MISNSILNADVLWTYDMDIYDSYEWKSQTFWNQLGRAYNNSGKQIHDLFAMLSLL